MASETRLKLSHETGRDYIQAHSHVNSDDDDVATRRDAFPCLSNDVDVVVFVMYVYCEVVAARWTSSERVRWRRRCGYTYLPAFFGGGGEYCDVDISLTLFFNLSCFAIIHLLDVMNEKPILQQYSSA